MSERKKRLEKLSEHRTRQLEAELVRLSEARAREQSAEQRLQREQAELARAVAGRAEAIASPFAVSKLTLSNDWMLSCAHRRELAEKELLAVRGAVVEAQRRVVNAKNELRKIELIAERIAAEERTKNERQEQRATDEFAAQRFGSTEKQRSRP